MANKPLNPVDDYTYKVRKGKILANKWVRLACLRHERDIKKYGRKHSSGIWFDEQAAQGVIDFFRKFLFFYEGEFDGLPFILSPHQAFIVGSLFGWKRGDFRRFRTAYIEESKGDGKTPMAAGIGIYGLVADGEKGAEIYAAATMREQAGILFRDAKSFAETSPSLRKKLNVGATSIEYPDNNSFFRPVSSEHKGLDGKRPHIALIDEIHEHPNGIVVDKMRAGTKGRRQALIVEITNSGYDRHSICYQHHEYTTKILEQIIENDAWFGFITGLDVCAKCEADGKTQPQDGCPDCDDWRDPKVWSKSTPNLGVTIKESYLREQVDEAIGMPEKENIVKRLNFNIWTDAITIWLPVEKWLSCYDSSLKIENFIGQPCYVGIDLANKKDFCAIVMVFEYETGFAVFAKFYLPEDTISESKNRSYKQWVKQGYIIETPGPRTDFERIENDLKEINDNHPIMELAFDPAYSTYLINNVMKWLGDDKCIEINQGPAHINEPMQELEAGVLAKTIRHNGDPVLSWMVSNVVKKEAKGGGPVKYYYPTKTNYENKIDGAVALIMAIGRAMMKVDTTSVYDGMTEEQIKARMAL
jgi:phage terminase large subunit-like protein